MMNTNQPMQLRAIVAELLSCYNRVNKKNNFSVVNAVSAELMISKSGNWLAPLMGDLYDIILTADTDQTIFIAAKSDSGKICLYVANRIDRSIPSIQPLPAKHQFGFRA